MGRALTRERRWWRESSTATADPRGHADGRRHLALVAMSLGGYAFLALLLFVGWQIGKFGIPGDDITQTYDPAGVAFRVLGSPYLADAQRPFFYAPPLALAVVALSLLPAFAAHLLILAADAWALYYMGRGWLGAGLLCWWPLVPFELALGNINLLVAAAIVAAIRGRGWPAALMTLAKLSPVLALDRRGIREFVLTMGAAFLITLPWLGLWPAWISQGMAVAGTGIGPLVPVPLWTRLLAAAALLALRRPWSRALAAVIATPGLYYGSLVMLVAPLAVAMESRRMPGDLSSRANRPPA